MKQVLITYPSMSIGGSTTSLLGMLDNLDYNRIQLDLQLYENKGPYLELLPKQVNLLPQARKFSTNRYIGVFQRLLHPAYWNACLKVLRRRKKYHGTLAASQFFSYARAKTARRNTKIYDVAIGFLEMWSDAYVYKRIKARKKIAWIHVDYTEAGMVSECDEKMLASFDQIVLVSESCLESFRRAFPQLTHMAVSVENILSQRQVEQRAAQESLALKKQGITFGTVCRISFRHKALERAIPIMARLMHEGFAFTWHIIGNGPDYPALKQLVIQHGLEEQVVLHGEKENPLPYVKQFDTFFLPSYCEGKPMAVTEAQMLGIPCVVTRYASAESQVSHNVDGYILDNSSDGIYEGLRWIFQNPDCTVQWKHNVRCRDWGVAQPIAQIHGMIME